MDTVDDEDGKGTTALAIRTKDGIFAVVESRKSREWVPKDARKANWCPSNTAKKWTRLTEKVLCIKVGKASDCDQMLLNIDKTLRVSYDDNISVSQVVEIAYNYLDTLRKQEKSFGCLLVGYDDIKGFQIYRLFIKGEIVVREEARETATLGSGYGYADDILVFGYDFNMSTDDAWNLVTKAAFNGTFYDKNSGGTIHVFHLTNVGFKIDKRRKSLLAYRDNFDHYDLGRMLFIIYEVNDQTRLISTDAFIKLFRLYGDILVAHRVDERKSHDLKFFFHRLVFTSSDEVKKVLNSPEMKIYCHKTTDAPVLSRFSYQLDFNVGGSIGIVKLRIREASLELVEHMIQSCPIQNAFKMDSTQP